MVVGFEKVSYLAVAFVGAALCTFSVWFAVDHVRYKAAEIRLNECVESNTCDFEQAHQNVKTTLEDMSEGVLLSPAVLYSLGAISNYRGNYVFKDFSSRREQWESAEATYRKALHKSPLWGRAWLQMARMQLLAGKLEGVDSLMRALQTAPFEYHTQMPAVELSFSYWVYLRPEAKQLVLETLERFFDATIWGLKYIDLSFRYGVQDEVWPHLKSEQQKRYFLRQAKKQSNKRAD